MFFIFFFYIIIILISLMFYFLNLIFSKKMFIDREKGSSFECGFDPLVSPRMFFSVQFFLIALIFLLFDVEIIFLFPLIYMFNFNLNIFVINFFFIFIFILLIGLFFEWSEMYLDWIE